MSQPDLEYILGYGSSGWLSGHLRAGEIRNASCGGAVRHRHTAKVFDGAGIWPQDLWLYQKDDGTFRLISRKPLDGLDILTPKIEIKMFQLLICCFSYEFGAKNVSKIEVEKWHFNTESYGLVVKVTPMLAYTLDPPGLYYSGYRLYPQHISQHYKQKRKPQQRSYR